MSTKGLQPEGGLERQEIAKFRFALLISMSVRWYVNQTDCLLTC